ncbi:hypothetical protein [Photobacterium nomapromontoriensis]|uniref:hypothetical protein n=1 Tax=Photobacterium nomapromontoriensis TaxID=2910237 RepID=UPI003D0B904D
MAGHGIVRDSSEAALDKYVCRMTSRRSARRRTYWLVVFKPGLHGVGITQELAQT